MALQTTWSHQVIFMMRWWSVVCPQGTFMYSRFPQQSCDYTNRGLKSAHLKWVKAEETSSPFGHNVKEICHPDVYAGAVGEKYPSTLWLMPAYISINACCLGQVKCSESKPDKSPHLTDTIKKAPVSRSIYNHDISCCNSVISGCGFPCILSQFCLHGMIYIHHQGTMKIRGNI